MKKAQIHTPTDLCLKFRGITASRLRDMARTKLREEEEKKNNIDINNSFRLRGRLTSHMTAVLKFLK